MSNNRKPTFSVKRNHVIISALVLMIAVAGYLNFMDSTGDYEGAFPLTSADEILALIMDDTLGQEVAVVNTTLDYAGNLDFTHDPTIAFSVAEGTEAGTAVFVNSANDSSFFIQAKLNREQARSSQMSSLTEMINNTNIAQEQRAATAEQLLDIQTRIERETAAEALIEAKGFSEVYVRIGDASVDVVVDTPQLSDQEIAQIEDVIRRKTGFTLDQIFISPLRQ
ncbi:MAG: SpoIIIAH-like family protein [Clostridiales bacterium]|jgi:stage III sporulation protein AH|nr:SpoIIIAH-like family protein [Clostridiales bacterium]